MNTPKIKVKQGYIIPRAYANEPFNLEKEIGSSAAYLTQFAPPGDSVKLICWSGDAQPWDTPLMLCKKAGLKNIGGGGARLDPDYPSILFVSPLGRKIGEEIQIYASNDAEISYTEGWRKRFFGFQHLPETLKNTNTPRRLKPIALHYHSYSGQFAESVNALIGNIEYIKTQKTIPIRTTRFCEIGEGFYFSRNKTGGRC